MTGEEFKGLKVGDEVVTLKELRVGNIPLLEGTPISVTATTQYPNPTVCDLVWGRVPGLTEPIRFSYADLSAPKRKAIEVISLEDVATRILDGKGLSGVYLGVPVDTLNSSQLLTFLTGDRIFLKYRE